MRIGGSFLNAQSYGVFKPNVRPNTLSSGVFASLIIGCTMPQNYVLSNDKLIKALISFADDRRTAKRLSWNALGGHSAERWLQFELAFRLNQLVGRKLAALCELNRRDIAIVSRPRDANAIWKQPIRFAIELKWVGNWYTQSYTFKGINADAAKVKGNDTPSMALVVWTWVKPDPSHRVYGWISEQIANGTGVETVNDIRQLMKVKCPEPFDEIRELKYSPMVGFEEAKLLAFTYRNRLASSGGQS